ncbi:hypothetical protein [Spirosoma endbachense]|uniref:Uncharacterized protein n=1 Tax=Spirosoma endbachense TaxID=2666025 RepID=A0A6P1VV45_9BACT|nr:hypothetical protein [Spirosoma endbachense]QHV96595.1 hypothetical protein GJR95_16945 [Spirosoma endbachense]
MQTACSRFEKNRRISLIQESGLTQYSHLRQFGLRLLVVTIGIFYTLAVLEVDPGETGDSFGDVFDTYVHSKPLGTSNTVTVIQERKGESVATAVRPVKPLIASPAGWLIFPSLPLLAFYRHRRHKHRPLHVLNAVWRL